MIGKKISHYEVTGKLGEGGMGEVYRARDDRLDRDVALKVLPAELTEDAERLARFEREAKVLASLNHPNIAAIYDVGQVDGSPFLVMELVEGKTLGDVIPGSGLSLERFFEMAIPLAEAVAAAHDRDVTHRDLKPANVMVDNEGRVKVLDFGLAKLRQVEGSEDETQTLADSVTAEGKIVGTVAYMSPEQAEGRNVDHRSDIFSLGAVLYEMTTGRRPFEGDSTLSTLSAILRDQPQSITELRRGLPRHLGRIIAHCLQKDPSRRYQSARDVVNELTELERELASGELEAPVVVRTRSVVPWVVAATAVVVAAAALLFALGRGPAESPAPSEARIGSRQARLTFDPGLEVEPAWSPDGRFIAYTAEREGNLDILLQPTEGGDPLVVVDDAGDDAQPAWSPDGSRLAFVSARGKTGRLMGGAGFGTLSLLMLNSGGDIYLQPALGGTAVRLVEDGYFPSWSPDGKTIAFMSARGGPWKIWLIDVDGGEPRLLSDEQSPIWNDDRFAFQPVWSPDGQWIASGAPSQGSATFALMVTSVDGNTRATWESDTRWIFRPVWSADGRRLFFTLGDGRSVDIWSASFTAEPEPLIGEPELVLSGAGWAAGSSVAPSGDRLAYANLTIDSNIWELDVASSRMRQVTFETTNEDNSHLSPDGKSLALVSNRSGESQLWSFELDGPGRSALAPVPGVDFGGRWSPDGKQVAYTRATEEGPLGAVQAVGEVGFRLLPTWTLGITWHPDGSEVAFTTGELSELSLHAYSLETEQMRRLTESPGSDAFPTYSADGRWVAFNREVQSGDRSIWALSIEDGDERQLTASPSEDAHPHFSPTDPNQLIFLRDHKNLWLYDMATGEERPLTSFDAAYLKLDYPTWGPNGEKIYFTRTDKSGDIFISGE